MVIGNLKLVQVKALFLDRPAVTKRLDKATLKLLRTVGGKTRLRARSSIRKAPKKRRSVGKRAPYNRTGLLKNNIFFALDPNVDSVVTGPIKLGGMSGNVPQLLEYGGMGRVDGKPAKYDEFPYMRPAFEYGLKSIDNQLRGMFR